MSPRSPLAPARSRTRSAVWLAGLLLAALGVLLAVADASSGQATGAAADGSFGTVPLVEEEPVLLSAPVVQAPARPPAPRQAPSTASQREADELIERLLEKMRAEREARDRERAERPAGDRR
ncbi:MAG: hypothetical protein O2894_00650 [Planctomycetota bacterium]|nr:hypothetical protein [Planctomycetota bacterium]